MDDEYVGYYESEFYKMKSKMMSMIEEKFNTYNLIKGFAIYGNENHKEFREFIKQNIRECDETEKWTLNEMCKMFSKSNCGWHMYYIAEQLHKSLIELWYPQNYIDNDECNIC